MATPTARPRSSARDGGAHGVVYACGARTGGRVGPHEALQGRRIRGVFGGRGQFVAVVDAWELDWQPSRDRSQVLEQETVALGLKGDLKLQQVAFGECHRVAVSLDGHLYSWGTRDAVLSTGELGHVASAWHPVTLTPRSAAAAGTPLSAAEKKTASDRPGAPPEQADDDGDNQFDDREASSSGPIAGGASVCLPRRVHAPKQLFFAKVACGAHHSIAVTDRGDLYAWGRNFEGQLGLGSTTLPTTVDRSHNGMCAWPKYVSALLGKPPAVDVACGDRFTVALLADGSLWRWGERVAGITGCPQAKTDAKPRRLAISGSSTESGDTSEPVFSGIAAGASHALGVTKSGALYAWGLNAYGQLGLGDEKRQSSDAPLRVPSSSSFAWSKVFAGSNYSAAIASDGQLFTWGSGHHGKLGHGATQSEFAPRAVAALRGVSVSSVVCGQFHLYAFAPTVVTAIAPTAGEVAGGYEMRIAGSGFWDSEDLTVRFVPLTEGRLPRGALARFDAASREIVCQVPTFNLPGEFAVEVATDGRHFTTDGHVFEAFRRPLVTRVSRWEARLAGGDEIEIEIDGAIPRSCAQPLLGLVVGGDAAKRIQVAGVVEAAVPSPAASPRNEDGDTKPSTAKTLVRFVTPSFAESASVMRCVLELSFNGGRQFSPIYVDADGGAAAASAQSSTIPKTPFVLQFHDAAVARCRPNSFQARALPTTIELEMRHLLTPGDRDGDQDAAAGGSNADWTQLSVALRIAQLNVSDPTTESRVDVTLPIVSVERSADTSGVVTCSVPPITQWKLSKLDAKTGERAEITTDWWKFVPRWGFEASVRVSMNGAQSLLPAERGGAVYGVFTVGKLLTASPVATPLSGGTIVSIAADYLHFDTDDAVVLLRWRDEREVRVPATCRAVAAADTGVSGTASAPTPLSRRLTFTTAGLPFPLPPPPPAPANAPPDDDAATASTTDESSVSASAADDSVGLSEEVEVLVSLDGRHFQRESSLKITYYRNPELLEIAPSEASPGARMTLKLDKAPPLSAAALASARVRLTTASLGLSTVVPVELNEAANAVEFELPALPIAEEDAVRVAFSLDGQQFSGDNAHSQPLDSASESARDMSFRYRAPPATSANDEGGL